MKHAKFNDVVKMLRKNGYNFDRQKGSHAIFTKPGAQTVSIPAKREVSPGVLRQLNLA